MKTNAALLSLGLLTTLSLGTTSCATAPLTGRSQFILLPAQEEMKMGYQSYQEVMQKEKLSTNPAYLQLVEKVGQRIAAAAARPDYQWEFKVIENNEMVNAFCMPGGKVAIYTGILAVTQDELGLAAVMGHEVAHALARHGAERVSQSMIAQTGLAAVSAAMASKNPETVKTVTGLLGAGASVGVILPFGRKQESEADRIGLLLMAKAGYNPMAAVTFWQRMAEASKGKAKPPEILSTHPSDATRIQQIQSWLPEALGYYTGSPNNKPFPGQ